MGILLRSLIASAVPIVRLAERKQRKWLEMQDKQLTISVPIFESLTSVVCNPVASREILTIP